MLVVPYAATLVTHSSFNGKPQATAMYVAIVACGLPLNESCCDGAVGHALKVIHRRIVDLSARTRDVD